MSNKILITGKNGFLAKNASEYFTKKGYEVLLISHNDSDELLEKYCKGCDYVFHFAAVQRAEKYEDFYQGNVEYTKKLIYFLSISDKNPKIIFSSSIAIDKESYFSKTKKEAEKLLREYAKKRNAQLYVFKLNNIFGKYGKINFNNVVATFCYNVSHDLPITINNPAALIPLSYVEDVMDEILLYIDKEEMVSENYITLSKQITKSLGEIVYYMSLIKQNVELKDDKFYCNLLESYEYYEGLS